ncbi:ADP-ribosylhydrolase ARH3-like [Saccostrea echinata]|uniref:ADP-ribosylhydrolase ARH3-like n=1 Tax=Saccostrea echinata TaxID=191078 RepID=UPI002A81CD97|nr:ADP-ribosylhydrolase ARH3-like [Saccostrea echinata]
MMSGETLLLKFKGALVGAVLGDCIGSTFEGLWAKSIAIEKVLKKVDKVELEAEKPDEEDRKVWKYTDDTAMARSVAKSLIEKKGLDPKHMAQMFSEEYFKEPYRGYGMSVITVFTKLKEQGYLDPFRPGAEQFNGCGSYGNGGAMRIVPAALFAYKENDSQALTDLVEQITKLTHTHPSAVDGALLQSYAVDLALRGSGELKIESFCDELQKRMKDREENEAKNAKQRKVENKEDQPDMIKSSSEFPYTDIVDEIKKCALQDPIPTSEEISERLGTDIAAYRSVPAAVYSFLRASTEINKLEGRNPFEKTIILAISLGGDTDTIATMAGAIAGAWYGIEAIPKSWQTSCEAVDDALTFATQLHKMNTLDK